MPTERFYKLTKEKKDKICSAVLNEFTRAPADKTSINRIIREAGISRGSFYTYFDGKWDAVNYLFDECVGDYYRSVCQCLEEARGNIWVMMDSFLDEALKLCSRKKEADFLKAMMHCTEHSDMFRYFWEPEDGVASAGKREQLERRIYAECVGKSLVPMGWSEFESLFQMLMGSAWMEIRCFFQGEPALLIRRRFREKENILRRAVGREEPEITPQEELE